MFDALEQIDRSLFLLINSWHSVLLDDAMFYISQIWIFFPLFIYWLYLVYRKEGFKKLLVLLAFTGLLVLLTDQTSTRTKHAVKRYRPTHNSEIMKQIHTVNDYQGGQYGFFSGHASNSFGIATLLFFMLASRPMWFRSLCFLWAGITAYSRIYLGVHYPSDIIIGTLVGIVWGLIIFELMQYTFKRYFHETVDV
jgi:undecaprenyl-diphosphatase